jgi:predicted DCC family thiol-disulfide oxidoreductase YuxK
VTRPPLLLYDGDCGFCGYWARYWQKLTGERVDYRPYQELAAQYPDIPREVRAELPGLVERLDAGPRLAHLVALADQVEAQRLPDRLLVLDQQDVLGPHRRGATVRARRLSKG